MPPVGDPFATFMQGAKLMTRVRFPAADFPHPLGDGFGHSVMRMYDERLMKGVSVGFLPIEWTFNEERGGFMPMDFKRQELIEISAEPVISNPDALAIARSKGIDTAPIVAWAETVRDEKSGLWVQKDAIDDLLEQAKSSKLISIPSETKAEPEAQPEDEPDPEDEIDAYVAATKTAEIAESKIVDTIVRAIDALAARKSAGLVSAENAERLQDAVAKAHDLLGPEIEVQASGTGDEESDLATLEDVKRETKNALKALSPLTGRLPY
jgi:hypothetical protein